MEYIVRDVTKYYGKNGVIKHFSFDFHSGMYLIKGKNGDGKSTLVKLISGIIRPSNKDYWLSKDKICYLSERIELSNGKPSLFLAIIAKLNKIKVNIKELLNKWKILDKDMPSLSKGNKQKVAILMTYLTNANIYIFDEATDALDNEALSLFKEYLKTLIDNNDYFIIID